MEAHRVLGLLLGGTGEKMKEAISHLERVTVTPTGATDVSVQFTLGRLYLLTGAHDQAIELLQRIVEEQPYLVQARVTLVQAFTAAGRQDDAIETLKPVVGNDPRLERNAGRALRTCGARARGCRRVRQGRVVEPDEPRGPDPLRHGAADNRAARGCARGVEHLGPRSSATRRTRARSISRRRPIAALETSSPPSARRVRFLPSIPTACRARHALALVFRQSRRYKDVINQLEPFIASATSRGDNAVSLLTYLSIAYQSLGSTTRRSMR